MSLSPEVIPPSLSAQAADALLGSFACATQAVRLRRESCHLLRPDGTPLAVLLKGALGREEGRAMWGAVRGRIARTENRGVSSGQKRIHPMRKDGTRSRTNRTAEAVQSGILGFYDRYPRIPYCRQTSFLVQHYAAYAACLPALRQADALFAQHCPGPYARQREVAQATHPDFLIPGTAFTTVTLNRNFRTAYHKDAGDLPEGFGVMSCYRAGKYTGGHLCMPRWGVGFALDSFDLLLFDPHEVHGNTEIKPMSKDWERITCVHYYRAGMRYCGSAAQELELAARHDARTQTRAMREKPQER